MSEELTPLDRIVRDRISAEGRVDYETVVELALYHPQHGFYATGGRAGRRADFITSAEVGPLFGRLVAEAADREWERCGRPDPFVVVDAGAGPGTLARSVLHAEPKCRGALRYVAVERSAAQRGSHPDSVEARDEMPDGPFCGFIIANELLDNLPFAPAQRSPDGVLHSVRVAELDGRLVEVPGATLAPADGELFGSRGDRVVSQRPAAEWLTNALGSLERGRVVIVDYARLRSADVEIRTYAEQARRSDPLERLGTCDITVDVDLAQLQNRVRPADRVQSQAEWLNELGIDELVAEGRAIWNDQAAVGDLDALRARSRIREADALLDADGLGGFTVAEWIVG